MVGLTVKSWDWQGFRVELKDISETSWQVIEYLDSKLLKATEFTEYSKASEAFDEGVLFYGDDT